MALPIEQLNIPAVEMSGVSKRFSRVRPGRWPRLWRRVRTEKLALDRIDLHVPQGEVTGVIGANGSGKSTLIRILGTLLFPDEGTASVFGHDVIAAAAQVRRHINRVSVEASFFKEMSGWENILYAARLYGGGKVETRARLEQVVARLGLPTDALDRPMKQLSRGQQQKVAIARSFLTSPSLLLMDEPTTGLDPRSKKEVQEMVRLIRSERAVTILLSTHDLQEAEALCDRVVIIDEGRVLADGRPHELVKRYQAHTLEDVFMLLSGKRLEEDAEEEDDE